MHRDLFNFDLLQGPVLAINLDGLDLGQRRETLVAQQLAEHGVQPVKVRRRGEGDKELAAVGVGPLVGHADDAALVVAQAGPDLVLEGRPVDGAPAFGVVGRVGVGGRASLRHE